MNVNKSDLKTKVSNVSKYQVFKSNNLRLNGTIPKNTSKQGQLYALKVQQS